MFEPDRLYRTSDPELEIIASRGVLSQWRHKNSGPPFIKLSNRILYRGDALNRWLEELTVEPVAA